MLRVYAACPDLSEVSCWRMSDALPFDPAWVPSAVVAGLAWEEAGVIVDNAGNVSVMVRIDLAHDGCGDLASCNRAIRLKYDVPTATLAFDAVVQFPSGSNKFKIGRRPLAAPTDHFYALTNPVTQVPTSDFPPGSGQRSLLILAHSTDLTTWQSCAPVAFDDTNLSVADSLRLVGLQYVDWVFDGDNLVAAVRAGYRGAVTYHDANRLLLTTVTDFAQLCETVVSGSGVSLHVLRNGLPAFANRGYVWSGVPASLSGMSVARSLGGVASAANVTVRVARPQTIYVGLCTGLAGHAPPPGWQQTTRVISYTDAAHTRMTLFSKHVASPGQVVAVPQDRTWCGAPLLYWPRGQPARQA